jgi:phospholipase C
VWSKTVFILTFDENDGFFDHVVAPVPANDPSGAGSTVPVTGEWYDLPESVNTYPAGWYGLGPRVPMLVVSPWSRGGWVNSEVFDHTSLIRFIEQRFDVTEPNISPWRRSICGDLTSALDFAQSSSSVPGLPSTAAYVPPDDQRHPDYVPVPPTTGSMPTQEPGLRPARPLPYDLAADAAVAGGTATVKFANRGAAGAVFHVTSVKTAARSYTIGAGNKLSDTWPFATGEDIRVHGPNGFYREFSGTGPDITAVAAGGKLTLAVANNSSAAVKLTLTSAYDRSSTSCTVPAGATVPVRVPTAAGTRWYDVKVTSDTDSSYLRAFAGHLETGQPDVSDPAFGRA